MVKTRKNNVKKNNSNQNTKNKISKRKYKTLKKDRGNKKNSKLQRGGSNAELYKILKKEDERITKLREEKETSNKRLEVGLTTNIQAGLKAEREEKEQQYLQLQKKSKEKNNEMLQRIKAETNLKKEKQLQTLKDNAANLESKRIKIATNVAVPAVAVPAVALSAVAAPEAVKVAEQKKVKFQPINERVFNGNNTPSMISIPTISSRPSRPTRLPPPPPEKKTFRESNPFSKISPESTPYLPRDIKHFWYRMWTDHGVPIFDNTNKKEDFIKFIDILYDDIVNDPGGTVIHCSAGVGRTGTIFVILQLCLTLGKKLSELLNNRSVVITKDDIDNIIKKIREKRTLLVQTFEQYEFLLKLFKVPIEGITNEQLQSDYNQLDTFAKAKTLTSNEAKKLCNTPKNRYTNTHPYDETRVILSKLSNNKADECSDYINASYLYIPNVDKNLIRNESDPFFSDANPFKGVVIAAQGPKENTKQDFLRMLAQDNLQIKRIIMLTNLVEGSRSKCYDYTTDEKLLDIPDKNPTGNNNIFTLSKNGNYYNFNFKQVYEKSRSPNQNLSKQVLQFPFFAPGVHPYKGPLNSATPNISIRKNKGNLSRQPAPAPAPTTATVSAPQIPILKAPAPAPAPESVKPITIAKSNPFYNISGTNPVTPKNKYCYL
jgi:protein tyrosine phosphatase